MNLRGTVCPARGIALARGDRLSSKMAPQQHTGVLPRRRRLQAVTGERIVKQKGTVTTVSTNALDWSATDKRAVDLVRVLAMDAVQKCGSGHPGTAMSLAPAAYLLYQRVLRHDPVDPKWPGRDRFVLSFGHSSLTQYIQRYLSGYGLSPYEL